MSKTPVTEIIFVWQVPVQDADINTILETMNENGKGWIDSISAFLVDDEEEE